MPYITVTFTDPPTPPTTDDPANFDSRGDAFLLYIDEDLYNELVSFKTQANDLRDEVNNSRDTAVDAKDTAVNAKNNAETARDYSSDWASQDAASGTVDDSVNDPDYSAKAYARDDLKGTAGGSSKNWAVTTGETVDDTEFSSKEYAQGTTATGGTAKEWAQTDEDVEVTSGQYSAHHWAQKSAKGQRLTATSSTSTTIGTGSKTLVLNETNRAFIKGSQVRLVENTDPVNNYMEGVATSYDDGTNELVVDVTNTNGSGTYSDWYIALNPGGDAISVGGSNIDEIKAYVNQMAIVLG